MPGQCLVHSGGVRKIGVGWNFLLFSSGYSLVFTAIDGCHLYCNKKNMIITLLRLSG